MQVVIFSSAVEVASEAARRVQIQIQQKQNAVIGYATGSTPILLYEELVRKNKKNEISFKNTFAVSLDEYVGLAEEHPQSYRFYMNQNLYSKIDIQMQNTFLPDGKAQDLNNAAQLYEEKIQKLGGIDLQILGIGRNGHIGFNEPTSSLQSRTRVKTLTQQTIYDNRRFFKLGEFQPSMAITMGIATILEAHQIILLATGESKAEAVAQMIEGPLSSFIPASCLQLHQKVSVLLDEPAASLLKLKDYYKWVYNQQKLLEKSV